MRGIWEHLGDDNNRKRLAFLGAMLSALAFASWTLFQYSENRSVEVSSKKEIEKLNYKIEILTKFVKTTCSPESTESEFQHQALPDNGVKLIFEQSRQSGGPGEVTFNAKEWQDVQSILRENQAHESQSYRGCVTRLIPALLEKFIE